MAIAAIGGGLAKSLIGGAAKSGKAGKAGKAGGGKGGGGPQLPNPLELLNQLGNMFKGGTSANS